MGLNRDELLKGRKLTVERVTLPAGRGEVFVRELDGRQASALQRARYPKDETGTATFDVAHEDANWAVLCACDEKGEPLFNGEFYLDRQQAETLPAVELAAIAAAAQMLNRVGPKAVLDAAKNS